VRVDARRRRRRRHNIISGAGGKLEPPGTALGGIGASILTYSGNGGAKFWKNFHWLWISFSPISMGEFLGGNRAWGEIRERATAARDSNELVAWFECARLQLKARNFVGLKQLVKKKCVFWDREESLIF
jgi:hypothetical protein